MISTKLKSLFVGLMFSAAASSSATPQWSAYFLIDSYQINAPNLIALYPVGGSPCPIDNAFSAQIGSSSVTDVALDRIIAASLSAFHTRHMIRVFYDTNGAYCIFNHIQEK